MCIGALHMIHIHNTYIHMNWIRFFVPETMQCRQCLVCLPGILLVVPLITLHPSLICLRIFIVIVSRTDVSGNVPITQHKLSHDHSGSHQTSANTNDNIEHVTRRSNVAGEHLCLVRTTQSSGWITFTMWEGECVQCVLADHGSMTHCWTPVTYLLPGHHTLTTRLSETGAGGHSHWQGPAGAGLPPTSSQGNVERRCTGRSSCSLSYIHFIELRKRLLCMHY